MLSAKWHSHDGDIAEACDKVLTDGLTQLIAREVLPMVPELLREEKPIPVWALKVVEECLESLPDTSIAALERCSSSCLGRDSCL